ncbi:MAG: type II glyceraldehyde-3-phosphate dehydrogenase [Planctomycetes bacterium]|nr:type II glyceraldehyde-3-phosphate dehydrogenase [Planctomycetota bacterium]
MSSGDRKTRVAVNGYGTIGKRVADAVRLQPDMELVGITAHSVNYRVATAHRLKGIPVFVSSFRRKDSETEQLHRDETQKLIDECEQLMDLPYADRRMATENILGRIKRLNDHLRFENFEDDAAKLQKNGVEVAGGLDDLLERADVVVDCAPKPFGQANKPVYSSFGVKGVYQGGEKASIGPSFVAQQNFDACAGADHVRVVSCNTTGLVRVLGGVHARRRIKMATVTLIRRGTDSSDHKSGPINAILPSLETPSHHGPDVRCVIPDIEVFSSAYVVPTTLMHVHDLQIEMEDDFEVDEILQLLHETPRVRVIPASLKMASTAQLMDFARDLGQNDRGDMMDICVWEQTVGAYRNYGHKRLFIKMAVHQESDVIPENVDAIRAVMRSASAADSMRMTDATLNLGVAGDFYRI